MLKEEWKDIKDWEGYYKISNLGRVLSVKSNVVKSLDVNSCGYLRTQLCKNGVSCKRFVHRLVAEHFIDGYFDGAVVNHKDFNKDNNSIDNLEWVTRSDNSKHAYVGNRQPGSFKDKPYKLVYSNGLEIHFKNISECAKSIGFCKNSLYNYINNHKGYIKTFDVHVLPCVSNDYPEKE